MVYGWGGSIGKSLIPEISQSVSNNNNSNDSKTTDASSNGKPPCDEDLSLSQEKHSALISSVLSKTVKLRKDVARNRKNKEILPKIDESIRLLTKLKDEPCPEMFADIKLRQSPQKDTLSNNNNNNDRRPSISSSEVDTTTTVSTTEHVVSDSLDIPQSSDDMIQTAEKTDDNKTLDIDEGSKSTKQSSDVTTSDSVEEKVDALIEKEANDIIEEKVDDQTEKEVVESIEEKVDAQTEKEVVGSIEEEVDAQAEKEVVENTKALVTETAKEEGEDPDCHTDNNTGKEEKVKEEDTAKSNGETLEASVEIVSEPLSDVIVNIDQEVGEEEVSLSNVENTQLAQFGKNNISQSDLRVDEKDLESVPSKEINTQPVCRMHAAVVSSLQSYNTVLNNPLKTSKSIELALDCIHDLISNNYVAGEAMGHDKGRGKQEVENRLEETKSTESPSADNSNTPLLDVLIDVITRCSNSTYESVQILMNKCLLAALTSTRCLIHEAAVLMAVRATFHIYLVSKSSTSKELAKSILRDMVKAIFSRMEAYEVFHKTEIDALAEENESKDNGEAIHSETKMDDFGDDVFAKGDSNSVKKTESNVAPFTSQLHTDAYLLFRALCKLSAKALPGDKAPSEIGTFSAMGSKLNPFSSGTTVDPLSLTSKLLSLELILSIFEHSGNAFCKGERFIYAIQSYLCVSLLKNCMSQHTSVSHLSLKIFVALVYKFKSYLKAEIEVFVANIFLKILESPNSPLEQKSLVLEAFRDMCSYPTILTQIFLNFDCDMDAVNLYKNIIQNLTRLSTKARLGQNANAKNAIEEFNLSVSALEVLVIITRTFLKALNLPGSDDVIEDAQYYVSSTLSNKQTNQMPTNKDSTKDATETENNNSETNSNIKSGSSSNNLSTTTPKAADFAGKIVAAFDTKRTKDEHFQNGLVKFKLSLKQGLNYFIKNEFVKLDARDMARFLLEHKEKLDMTQIGEVLGKEPDSSFVKEKGLDAEKGGEGFFVRILSHYVAALDFTGLEFDEAIRLFLSGFRLPGEAQKIDRIMEKFAERYTYQNGEVFASADTAFILAFSVIMLQTDLHNPSIKPEKRMTVEGFIRNNRGISVDGGNLPNEFLEGIYHRIQANPFTLKEDDEARAAQSGNAGDGIMETSYFFESQNLFGSNVEERKKEKFRLEREAMMQASEQLFKRRPKSAGRNSSNITSQMTDSISPSDVVKPMFYVAWGPLIGTLSQILEMANDERSISLCLNGFVYSIRISSHSEMSLARDTFVSSLAKFTTLGSIQQMKPKNIECIKTLLSIAIVDGEFLGESWGSVLQCISQLGRLQLLSSGLDSEDAFLMNDKSEAKDDSYRFFRSNTKDMEGALDRETEHNNGRAVLAEINEALIDKVFSSTVQLSARGIVHFVECLVAVSDDEIAGNIKKGISGVGRSFKKNQDTENSKSAVTSMIGSTPGFDGPRIFSLQRLVEVADFNMDVRPRIAWTQMWELMANHFATIGCHKNAMVSMFAIDALRQLSFKFLEKPELADFNFQRLFLKPFLQIMENPGSRDDIRELILRCIDNMVRSISHNLRSGWKIIFSILKMCAFDNSEKISTLGLAILQRLLDHHIDDLFRLALDGDVDSCEDVDAKESTSSKNKRFSNVEAEDFVGLCRASLSYVQTDKNEVPLPIGLSMRALCHSACFADLIVDGKVLPPIFGAQTENPDIFGYTYDGLEPEESLEMVLWRPLFDGLAAGICSSQKSQSGGVGCLVQRGSVIATRAILLRHGHLFSVNQWRVILNEVLIPAIKKAARNDQSPVVTITSDSPMISNLDFLSNSPPLPPQPDDERLMKFATNAQSEESGPTRPFGRAELLVEASFADLRHGGDGNPSRAYATAKKDVEVSVNEQPFPDSWIATTAPIALGMLIDVFGEILLKYDDCIDILWPIISEHIQSWYLSSVKLNEENVVASKSLPNNTDNSSGFSPSCEAIVRIGCNELLRAIAVTLDYLENTDVDTNFKWMQRLSHFIADSLRKNTSNEEKFYNALIDAKLTALGLGEPKLHDNTIGEQILTPYGEGVVKEVFFRKYGDGEGQQRVHALSSIELQFGGILYSSKPAPEGTKENPGEAKIDNLEESNKENNFARDYLKEFMPSLKVTCIASHCLHLSLHSSIGKIVNYCSIEDVTDLMSALNNDSELALKARQNEDVAHAFQEAMFNEWGDGVEEVEAALASLGRMNHRESGKSELFFLTQEAGSNNSIIYLLAALYCGSSSIVNWDSESFTENLLMDRIVDILRKFLESEEKESPRMDPNVWRHCHEGGGMIAVYCTSFANVVVNILKVLLLFSTNQFQRHNKKLFPILCDMVRVQSDEVRKYVREILVQQVGPMINFND